MVRIARRSSFHADSAILPRPSSSFVVLVPLTADHIDVPLANKKGIKIGHTPGVLSDAVADITIALLLMAMRRMGEGIEIVKEGRWPQIPWAPFVMCGPSIGHPNLTIGFLGFGRISQVTLDRLVAFTNKDQPPKILYTSSKARPNQAEIDADFSKQWDGKVASVSRVEADELAEKSDIVIVLCALNESTKDLVNKDFLRKMKKTAVLVNSARGPIVNSDDLADALDQGEIFAAGLDVITDEPNISPDHRLVKHPKCVVIPHMGSADYDTRNAMADLCVRNAIAGAEGKPLPAEVKV